MALPDYEGKIVGTYREWEITDCPIRPAGMRFEAHPLEQDGTIASLFSSTMAGVHEQIDDYLDEEVEWD